MCTNMCVNDDSLTSCQIFSLIMLVLKSIELTYHDFIILKIEAVSIS